MKVKELHEQLSRLVADGNGDLDIVATVDGSGVEQAIEDIEVYDDPPFIVLPRQES